MRSCFTRPSSQPQLPLQCEFGTFSFSGSNEASLMQPCPSSRAERYRKNSTPSFGYYIKAQNSCTVNHDAGLYGPCSAACFAGRAAGWQPSAVLHADLLRCPMGAGIQGVSVFSCISRCITVEPRTFMKLCSCAFRHNFRTFRRLNLVNW